MLVKKTETELSVTLKIYNYFASSNFYSKYLNDTTFQSLKRRRRKNYFALSIMFSPYTLKMQLFYRMKSELILNESFLFFIYPDIVLHF